MTRRRGHTYRRQTWWLAWPAALTPPPAVVAALTRWSRTASTYPTVVGVAAVALLAGSLALGLARF